MKKIVTSLLVIIGISFQVFSQEPNLKDLFLAAESYFLFEEFDEALPLYLRIHRQEPENANVNFKIGVCYLNDPFQRDKSISYLERASNNINPKYKENNFKEIAAPQEVLFYLGNAYRINNQLEKAKESYRLFISRVDSSVYDIQLVEEQIIACENAAKLIKKPVDFDVENLGNTINTRFSDINPVISGDDTKMAFVSKLQFYDAVFFTEKINGEWTAPRNIIPELGVDGDVYPTCLSHNGSEMIIYRRDEFIGNLYSSVYVNGKWTPLKKLNENINTRFWESHGSLSKDGMTLYFSSNRRGGYGGLDIYKSERQPNGEWGIPVNLGPTINSKYNDDTPFITESGDRLFFSSYGHFNMGGYDIQMSKKNKNGSWSNPVNIGYPLNTTDDDQFMVPLKDGQIAYYSRHDATDGFGRHDILRYRIYTVDHPRMFPVQGLVGFMGTAPEPRSVTIAVVDASSRDTLHVLSPATDGTFRFEVPAGKYDMIFDSDKFHKKIVPLNVPADTPHTGIILDSPVALELKPVPLSVEELENLLTIREDSIIYAREGEEVRIRYNAEKDSEVVIDVFNKGKLVLTDTTIADRRRQSFDFLPLPGESEVRITVTDEDGNTISKSVKVIVPERIADLLPVTDEAVSEDEAGTAGEASPAAPEEISSIRELIEQIKQNAAPELKEYLEKLDPGAAGLVNRKDLVDHLYNAAESEAFTTSQVSDALKAAGLIDDLDAFIRDLAGVASPELKEYLLGLEPDKEGIQDKSQLIKHLYDKADENSYTAQDVTNALNKLNGLADMKKLIEELKKHADGALLEYLNTLDPAKHSIFSLEDLQKHLLENADENGYTREDVINMFRSYFDSQKGSMKKVLEKMMRNSEDKLFDYLESIHNSWDDSLENRKVFYDHLFTGAEKQKITPEELIPLALDAEEIRVQNLRDHIIKYGSPQLKEALADIPQAIRTPGDLYKHLLMDPSVDKEEITDLARDYLYNKELYDQYYSLLRNSEGALKEYLESLDIRNSGFSSPGELIDHLLAVAAEKGFSKEDVYDALGKSFNESRINQIISDLIKLAEGNLKNALLSLDPLKEGVKSLEDIVNFLLRNKDAFGYSEQDVYDLIMKYLAGESGIETLDESELFADKGLKEAFGRGAKLTAGILILEGIIILILIILARRKKKKDQKQGK